MVEYRLEIIGTPRAVHEGVGIHRLRTKRDWGILASLALEPGLNERGALARRFWPQSSASSQNLRSSLTSIRSALGADILEEENGTLRLHPGCVTDLAEMRAALWQARRLQDSSDATLKVSLLREASLLIRGPFLQGVDSGETHGWVERYRAKVHSEVIALFREWMAMCHASGDESGMTEAAERLLAIDPNDENAQNLILQNSHPIVRRLNAKMDWSATESALAITPLQDIPLTFSDVITLQALMDKRLEALPRNLQRSLCLLSIFPDSFTAEHSLAISGVIATELNRFIEERLLHFAPKPDQLALDQMEHPVERRYVLREAVRETLWRRLTGAERNRLAEKHARYFAAQLQDAYEQCYTRYKQHYTRYKQHYTRYKQHIDVESTNLVQAIDWYMEREPSQDGVDLLESASHSWQFHHKNSAQFRSLRRTIPYLQRAIATCESPFAAQAAGVIAALEAEERNFAEAVRYWQICLNIDQLLVNKSLPCNFTEALTHLLNALHHAGEDDLLDKMVTLTLSWDLSALCAAQHIGFLGQTRYTIAESLMARGRFAEALPHSEESYALSEMLREHDPEGFRPRGPLWYQRGNILQGLGRTAEAWEFYSQALDAFEEAAKTDSKPLHGIASCLRNLAIMNREGGRHSEARGLLGRARELFERVGDPAAVVSCDLILGDVRRDRCEWDEAERLYCAGLTFWREKGHHRWISSCEARLQELQARRQEGKEEAK